MSANNELYQQVILDHNKQPRNYGELVDRTHHAEGYNPLCGDHIWVSLKMDNDAVQDVQFSGDGCAICKASASMMTTIVKGKQKQDVNMIFKEFIAMVKGELNPEKDEHHLGKLQLFSGIWQYPSRVKCAALAWHTLNGAFENVESVSTE